MSGWAQREAERQEAEAEELDRLRSLNEGGVWISREDAEMAAHVLERIAIEESDPVASSTADRLRQKLGE